MRQHQDEGERAQDKAGDTGNHPAGPREASAHRPAQATQETTLRGQGVEGERAAEARLRAVYAAVDVETSGLSCRDQEALSVAVVLANRELEEVAAHHWLILPERLHNAQAEALVVAGYDEARWLAEGLPAPVVARNLFDALKGKTLLAHNLPFDKGFIADVLRRGRLSPPWGLRAICTLRASRSARDSGAIRTVGCRLPDMCAVLNIPFAREEGAPHSALDDARACLHLAHALRSRGLLK